MRYDKTDAACRKIIKKQVETEVDSSDDDPLGEINADDDAGSLDSAGMPKPKADKKMWKELVDCFTKAY